MTACHAFVAPTHRWLVEFECRIKPGRFNPLYTCRDDQLFCISYRTT
jgi:hypothetical protein